MGQVVLLPCMIQMVPSSEFDNCFSTLFPQVLLHNGLYVMLYDGFYRSVVANYIGPLLSLYAGY